MAGLQGRAFGGFQLVEQLPAGGIADVYRGRPAKPGGRDVVVKVVYPEFARQPGFLPRFRHIVQMSGQLASHPHILPLLAHGEDAGYLYLVTPFVEAGTLRDWQRKGGHMSLADAGPFFRQLCDALSYAHSLSVVHGNLKPSNIFLFEGRHVLLGDFGMLWDVSHMDMNHAGSGAEAVEFLAPDVMSGQVTQLSDIYSLGAVLFSAVAGHAPFHGGKPADVFAAHAQRPVPSLAQVNPSLASSAAVLDAVIQRAMAKRPEDRYPSAAAVAQAIDLAARQPQAAPPAFAASSAPGFAPFGVSTPQGLQPPYPPQPAHPAFGSAPIAPAFGVPPGGVVAGMGAAVSGAVVGGLASAIPNSGLTQLDPPFPPLPASARVEEQMEQGRIQPPLLETGTQATVRVPAPAGPPAQSAGLPMQPTMRVPAPAPPASPVADGSRSGSSGLTGLLESSPQLPSVSPSASAPPGERPYRISGAPAARLRGLSGAAGSAAGSSALAPGDLDDDEDDQPGGHQMLAAVRPGSSGLAQKPDAPPPVSGFAVAGGGGAMPGLNDEVAAFGSSSLHSGANGWDNASSVFAPGESREWRMYEGGSEAVAAVGGGAGGFGHAAAGWGGAPGETDEHGASGWGSQYTGEHAGYDGQKIHSDELRGHTANSFSGGSYSSGEKPFSPTRLDLPRLTSPVLIDQPPSFHDILSESSQLPRFDASVAEGERPPTWADAGEGMWDRSGSASLAPWRSNPPNGGAASEGWAGGAHAPSATAWDSPSADEDGTSGKKRGKNGKRGRRAEADDDSGFDDERVWTVGTTAIRAGRRRWVRKVALLMMLVLLVDLIAIVVARPDLCPTANCKQVSAYIHQTVPFLHPAPVVPPTPLVAVPAALTFSVTAGKSGTIPLVIKNTGKVDLTWNAAVTLSWLSITPAAGTLGAGAPQALTVSAKPIGIKPGSYTSALTVTTNKGALSVPITIAVAAGALLTITPASLSFSTCGATQTVTLTNGGAAPLNFTAVPSQTSALSLDTTSGSLGPGQSRAISVTLLCAATSGNEYTVNIISNSGSAVVVIHYT